MAFIHKILALQKQIAKLQYKVCIMKKQKNSLIQLHKVENVKVL